MTFYPKTCYPLRMGNDVYRLKTLLGSQVRIAEALGLSPEHVSRLINGSVKMPEYIPAIVELLEALPRKDWPERFESDRKAGKGKK